MKTKTIVLDKKSKQQCEDETNAFIVDLKSKVKALFGEYRAIKLPGYMYFNLDEKSKTAMLHIQKAKWKKEDGSIIFHNATIENMQTDDAAFEGWAVCLMAWLPEKVQRVMLDWDEPEDKNGHYNRFMYRVFKFTNSYPWLIIPENKKRLVSEFAKGLINLENNCGNKDPDEKEKQGENMVEYRMIHTFGEEMCEKFNLTTIDHQLPIGIRKNGKSFFTGHASAIDIWGLNNKTLSLFELKFSKKKTPNEKVGIISELFLYTSVMADIISGKINPPTNCNRKNEILLYKQIRDIKCINAYMLTNGFHPLIEKNEILDILNAGKRDDGISINYIQHKYKYSFDPDRIVL